MRWLAKVDPSVQKISGWITFIAGVGAFLSWVASNIPPLSPYGWGAFVFVGLAAACVLSLVISVGLIAWRFFKPLSPTTVPIATPWRADIKIAVSALEKYVDEMSAALANKIVDGSSANSRSVVDGFRELASKIDAINADIGRFNKLGVSQHEINDDLRAKVGHQAGAQAVILADLRNLERKVGYLIKAIRASDAKRDVLLPNDKIAMALGKRLAEAKAADYPDYGSWFSDHQKWQTALRAIDRLVASWAEAEHYDGYAPFFALEPRHFQHSPMPPANIRTDDIIVPFKTVVYAESSYARQRDNIFHFFDMLAALPPG